MTISITEILDHIKKQVGADLVECPHFSGVRNHNGCKYVNILLAQRTSESSEFTALQQLSKISSIFSHVEPNGVDRVAVFLR